MPETQNVYQKRWREKNREAYNKAQLKFVNKYYENNKQKVLDYKREYYIYKKEASRLMNILIEE